LPLALHLCAAGPVEIIAALGAGTRLRWPRAYTPRAGGYRTPSKAGWLGPAVSGLRARPPTPSARAPRSCALAWPAARHRARIATAPSAQQVRVPSAGGAVSVRARTGWVLRAACP